MRPLRCREEYRNRSKPSSASSIYRAASVFWNSLDERARPVSPLRPRVSRFFSECVSRDHESRVARSLDRCVGKRSILLTWGKSTNGFRGKEDVDSTVADTPQPSCNLYGFFILLPINFETKHDLVSRKRSGVSIVPVFVVPCSGLLICVEISPSVTPYLSPWSG